MKKTAFLLMILILLVSACSEQSRRSIVDWVRESGGPAAVEGAQVGLTAAVEAAQTNVPMAQTAGAAAAATGRPMVGTLVAEGVPVAGTLGAEFLGTGEPLAGTAVAAGLDALRTRTAQEPGYRCPDITYTTATDLNGTADISGAQLDAAIAATVPGSPLIGLGQSFVNAGLMHNINAYYVAAHAAWDSSWGTNTVAARKNNLFGYGVTPDCPFDCAVSFASPQDSIDLVTSLVKTDYLTPGGRFYTAPTLAGMEPIYSGNPEWADGVAAMMNLLRQKTPCP